MRSKLFVPASRPELFQKAESSEADAISFDLEDAVDDTRKAEARATLAAHLGKPRMHDKQVIARVNAIGTPDFEADIAAVLQDGLDIVNLPKVEDVEQLRHGIAQIESHQAMRTRLSPLGILVNIESAAGLQNVSEIARAHPWIIGLQIGFGDLFVPLGVDQNNLFAIAHVRWTVRMAAAQASINAYDGAFLDIASPAAFRENARAARDMGFMGKTCIHPSQIALANEVFCFDPDELAFAERVVSAANEAKAKGVGAFVVDGRMVDGPFISRALRVVREARRQSVSS